MHVCAHLYVHMCDYIDSKVHWWNMFDSHYLRRSRDCRKHGWMGPSYNKNCWNNYFMEVSCLQVGKGNQVTCIGQAWLSFMKVAIPQWQIHLTSKNPVTKNEGTLCLWSDLWVCAIILVAMSLFLLTLQMSPAACGYQPQDVVWLVKVAQEHDIKPYRTVLSLLRNLYRILPLHFRVFRSQFCQSSHLPK